MRRCGRGCSGSRTEILKRRRQSQNAREGYLARELVAAGDSLERFPDRGWPGLLSGTRELVIVRPYIMVYEVTDIVTILRIWHSAQKRDR